MVLALNVPSIFPVPVATVFDVETELSYDDPYGPLQFGALHMKGILRYIQADFNDDGRTFELSMVDEQVRADGSDKPSGRLRYIGSSYHEYYGSMCNLELDRRPETVPLRCYCLLTAIEEWAQNLNSYHRNISCLLLEPHQDGDDVYKRLGMLTLEDLYSIKMRYREDYASEEGSISEEDDNMDDETALEDDGSTGEVSTARLHEVRGHDNVVTADLAQVTCWSGGTTAAPRDTNAFETNDMTWPGRTR